MNRLSTQTGKHRHVSHNTLTLSRISCDRGTTAMHKVENNAQEKLAHTGTAGKTSLLRRVWGKLTNKFFRTGRSTRELHK